MLTEQDGFVVAGGVVQSFGVLQTQLQQWRVPSDVREAVQRAVATVSKEGTPLVEATVGDQVALAVRGQPAAVYVSPSRVSMALAPSDAERAQRSDSAFGLDKEGETTWILHCRYGRMDSSRLNTVTALMVRALRRHAPRTQPRPAGVRTRRRPSAEATDARPTTKHPASARSPRRSEEDRQRAVEAAIPRCPVPGCNLPMVGGSCGFHD